MFFFSSCPQTAIDLKLMDEELTESLWVRIKGRAGTGDIMVDHLMRKTEQTRPSVSR